MAYYQIEWHGQPSRGENHINFLTRIADKKTAECTAQRLAQYADVPYVEIIEIDGNGDCRSIYKHYQA